MTPEELDAIEARANAATPGPWIKDYGHYKKVKPLNRLNKDGEKAWTWRGFVTAKLREDGAFIAHARQDVPALVAEVRRLRAELAQVSGEREESGGQA